MTRTQGIRHEALLQLYGSRPLAISAALIHKVARRQGEDFSLTEIQAELHFLQGQELAKKITDPVTGEERYEITSKGVIEWENKHAA